MKSFFLGVLGDRGTRGLFCIQGIFVGTCDGTHFAAYYKNFFSS